MTDGMTKTEIFEVLSDVLGECGMIPVTAKRESIGVRDRNYAYTGDVC